MLIVTDDPVGSAFVDSLCTANGWLSNDGLSDSCWLVDLPDTNAVAVVDSVNSAAQYPVSQAGLDYVAYVTPCSSRLISEVPLYIKLPNIDGYVNEWYYDQWPLGEEFLNVVDVWEHNTGSTSTVVAIIDTGIDLNHPEWAWRIGQDITVYSCVSDNGNDTDGHGTMVAGTILAAHDDAGIHGVAPGVKAEIYKVFEDGSGFMDIDTVGEAFDLIAAHAQSNPNTNYVVNMSVGWPGLSWNENDPIVVGVLSEKIAALEAAGNVLVCAAAGNQASIPGLIDDPCSPQRYVAYPGAFSGETVGSYYSADNDAILVTVGALTASADDYACYVKSAEYTCWAGSDTCEVIVDVSAPGGSDDLHIPVCSNSGGYSYWLVQTSGATAYVAGAAALIWSEDPSLTPQRLKARLRHGSKYKTRNGDWYTATGCLRNKNFRTDPEDYCGIPVAMPIEYEEPVWPPGAVRNSTLDVYDEFCSYVFGSGMPDCGQIISDVNGGGCSYTLTGRSLGTTLLLEDCTTIFAYSDYEILSGGNLVIVPPSTSPSTRFKLPANDSYNGGFNTSRCEVLIWSGGSLSSTGSIDLRLTRKADTSRIGQLRCLSGSNVSIGGKCSINHSTDGLMVDPDAIFSAGSIFVESDSWALRLGEDVTTGSVATRSPKGILVDNASFTLNGSSASDIYCSTRLLTSAGIKVLGAGEVVSQTILSMTGWWYGVLVSAGSGEDVMLPALNILDSVYGVYVDSARNVGFDSSTTIVDVGSGSAAGVVVCSAQMLSTNIGSSVDIVGYGVGVSICSSSVSVVGDFHVHGATGDGVRVSGATGVVLEGITVANSVNSGVQVADNSSVDIRSMSIDGCTVGVNVVSSSAEVRETSFEGNEQCVVVGSTSTANLGNTMQGDPGLNAFGQTSSFQVVNLNNLNQVLADGNTWYYHGNWMCPPSPAKVIGSVRRNCI